MTNDEEYLLKEALSMLGQFDGLPNLDSLEGLRLGLGVRNNDRRIISLSKTLWKTPICWESCLPIYPKNR